MITSGDLRERFQAAGLRITPQRNLIFRLVEEIQADHPTAEALYVRAVREIPSMSLRTVYAVLAELEEGRAVRPLELGTGSMRFCTNINHHHHLVCERCGKVKDVFIEMAPVEIPAAQRDGFVVKEQAVVFRGLCADCRGAPA